MTIAQTLTAWGEQGTRNVLRMSSMLSYATRYAQFLRALEGTPQNRPNKLFTLPLLPLNHE